MFPRHVFDRLAPYAEGQLEPADASRVERHLDACGRCRAALADVRRGIALASELQAESMPGEMASAMRARLVAAAAAPHHSWRRTAWRAAAAVLLAAAAAGIYWQVNRPWAQLRSAGAGPAAFEREGRAVHDRLLAGENVDFVTSDEHEAWRWLGQQRAPVTSLIPNRGAEGRARFVPLGAAVRQVAGVRASVLAYRIDGEPVTLVLARASEVRDAPRSGWWSKRVIHRRDARGVNTLTWTVGGGTYVLVSELEGYGQRACFICHTDARFQEPIRALSIR